MWTFEYLKMGFYRKIFTLFFTRIKLEYTCEYQQSSSNQLEKIETALELPFFE